MSYQAKVTDKITEFMRGFGLPQTLKEAGADIPLAERMAESDVRRPDVRQPPRSRLREVLELFRKLLA